MSQPRQGQGHQEVVISEAELPTLLFKAGATFAKKHYMLSGSWLLGLLICLFAQGFQPEPTAVEQYEACLIQMRASYLVLIAGTTCRQW